MGDDNDCEIVSIHRIQNLALYPSYYVKRHTVQARYLKNPAHLVNNPDGVGGLERQLYHGTHPDAVLQIEIHGLNRNFADRNAVAYGHGMYIALDAPYSSDSTYAVPDRNRIQHVFG